jgi:hypothetical protein
MRPTSGGRRDGVDGDPLPPGVCALARADGAIVGYKARWREDGDDGVRRDAAKRFSVSGAAVLTRRALRRTLGAEEALADVAAACGDIAQLPDELE